MTRDPTNRAESDDDIPTSCECDNGHEQTGTVCRYCYGRGWRDHSQRWPTGYAGLQNALNLLVSRLRSDDEEAFERIDMLTNFIQSLAFDTEAGLQDVTRRLLKIGRSQFGWGQP